MCVSVNVAFVFVFSQTAHLIPAGTAWGLLTQSIVRKLLNRLQHFRLNTLYRVVTFRSFVRCVYARVNGLKNMLGKKEQSPSDKITTDSKANIKRIYWTLVWDKWYIFYRHYTVHGQVTSSYIFTNLAVLQSAQKHLCKGLFNFLNFCHGRNNFTEDQMKFQYDNLLFLLML